MVLKRRQFSREFKLQMLSELDSGKSRAQICREHQFRPSLLDRWRSEFKAMGNIAFPGSGVAVKPESRVGQLERIIGQLTLENTILKKALRRLGETATPPEESRNEK